MKTIKTRSKLQGFRGVITRFRARVIAQMKEDEIRNKMVVVVLLWGRWCDGYGRKRGPTARVEKGKRERVVGDGCLCLCVVCVHRNHQDQFCSYLFFIIFFYK